MEQELESIFLKGFLSRYSSFLLLLWHLLRNLEHRLTFDMHSFQTWIIMGKRKISFNSNLRNYNNSTHFKTISLWFSYVLISTPYSLFSAKTAVKLLLKELLLLLKSLLNVSRKEVKQMIKHMWPMQIRFYSTTVQLHTEHIQLWNQQEIFEAFFEKGRKFAWFESHRQKFERNEQFIFIVFCGWIVYFELFEIL